LKATTYYDLQVLTVGGTANLTANMTRVLDTLTINTGTTLSLAGDSLALDKVMINNGTLTATTIGSTLVFQGTALQTLTGTITLNQIMALVVNDTAGVSIPNSIQLNRGLRLTGRITFLRRHHYTWKYRHKSFYLCALQWKHQYYLCYQLRHRGK